MAERRAFNRAWIEAAPLPIPQGFQPSPQQADFFEWIKTGKGSAILEAVAGAGKTTTLVEALKLMTGSIFFGAYNKKIAEEIKAKAAPVARDGLFISTMHAAGFKAWTRAHPKVVVDSSKVAKLVAAMLEVHPELTDCRQFIMRMVAVGKAHCMGVTTPMRDLNAWLALVAHYAMEDELPEGVAVADALTQVIGISISSRETCHVTIDFDDMIYAPLAHDARFYQHDWVLIDECQDLNASRREMARRMLKSGGRLVAVGDSCQAIYGFTGAGADSVGEIATAFRCARLPLTVTYRCPKAVVAYVHQWVNHIQAHPSAPEGNVTTFSPVPGSAGEATKPWFVQAAPSATSAVLCRYTRPLIQTAYAMLRHGHACKVEGRDIGQGLIKLALRWRVRTLDALETRLDAYLAREQAKALAKDNERLAQDAEDRVATLRIFIERVREKHRGQAVNALDALKAEIESLFADDVQGVTTLSTGHKAKGREWGDVYWLQAALKMRRPLLAWEAVQERNLNYVIGTRAKAALILIPEAFVSA